MKRNVLFLTSLLFFYFISSAHAQTLYGTIDWKMAAIVSASDTTNGLTSGDPRLGLGYQIGTLGLELGFVKHGFENDEGEIKGPASRINIEDTQFHLGVKLNFGPLFFSRLGFIWHDIQTTGENAAGQPLSFSHDGSTLGFYAGGGFELPIQERFALMGTAQIETANSEILIMSLLFGVRINLMEI